MKNPTIEVLTEAVEAKLGGMKSEEVLSTYDLSHSQFELAFWRLVPVAQGGMKEWAGKVEFTGENVQALREYFLISWGRISILVGRPESAVRKLYKETARLLSQGQRIGKGGRWFLNERELYTDGLQRPGTKIDEARAKEIGSTRAAALISANEQKLIHKDTVELKAIAKAEGVKVSPKATKAQLVKAIVKQRAA